MQMSMFSSLEPHVSPSASRVSEKDWTTRVVTSCSPLVRLLNGIAPAGWYGRMCPEFSRPTKEGILEPSSGCWANSGMGSHTEFLTLNLPEHNGSLEQSHNDDGVSSLSDILETGALPPRFFLSAKASQGILRRSEKRGKQLNETLRQALEEAASRKSAAPSPTEHTTEED